jgi:hypothetical protein
MLHRIHQKLGTAGFIISIVALVAALGGGAFAASGGLTGKQKKEVEKIAKKVAGKPGANGTNGTNGAPGAKGDKGDSGTNGTNGTNGTSATTEAFSGAKGSCASGGVTVKSASPEVNVCNGETGFTPTLPPGETEVGTWAFGELTAGSTPPPAVGNRIRVPLSFTIPLEEGLAASQVHFLNAKNMEVTTLIPAPNEVSSTVCLGNANEPKAKPGNLCVYTGVNPTDFSELAKSSNEYIVAPGLGPLATSTAGAIVQFNIEEAESFATGSFAVTAEE